MFFPTKSLKNDDLCGTTVCNVHTKECSFTTKFLKSDDDKSSLLVYNGYINKWKKRRILTFTKKSLKNEEEESSSMVYSLQCTYQKWSYITKSLKYDEKKSFVLVYNGYINKWRRRRILTFTKKSLKNDEQESSSLVCNLQCTYRRMILHYKIFKI